MRLFFGFLIIGFLFVGGCGSKTPIKSSPFSVGLNTYKGQYLQFNYPSSAKMYLVSTTESYLLGPELSLHPNSPTTAVVTSANFKRDSKYAYQIHIQIHDNPMRLHADVWAKNYIIHEWKFTQGGPSIYPVTQEGHIMDDFMSFVQVGKEKAFMLDIFGYDYTTRSLFIEKDNIVIELSFILLSGETDASAVLQKDIYALILGSLSFVGK